MLKMCGHTLNTTPSIAIHRSTSLRGCAPPSHCQIYRQHAFSGNSSRRTNISRDTHTHNIHDFIGQLQLPLQTYHSFPATFTYRFRAFYAPHKTSKIIPRRSIETSSCSSVAFASSKVTARSAPKKLTATFLAKESKSSLCLFYKTSSRIVKNDGSKAKSEFKSFNRNLVKQAQQIWDKHQKDLYVIALDTEYGHEKYNIFEGDKSANHLI